MKPEHEQYLRTTYPLLYSEPYLPCDGGFRCGDGWFDLINCIGMSNDAQRCHYFNQELTWDPRRNYNGNRRLGACLKAAIDKNNDD